MKKVIILLSLLALSACINPPKQENAMDNPVIESILARRLLCHYTVQPVPR